MVIKPIIVTPESLSCKTRDAMFTLHARYFENISYERFMNDLGEKDWVILLLNETGGIAGFSTQKLISLSIADSSHHFLFSGDTIIDQAHRNTPLLSGSFGHLMLRLMNQYGEGNLHWFLISKGFRTYRFLPVFFNRFWPAPNVETPPEKAALLDAIAQHKFGTAYDSLAGVIRPLKGDRLAGPASAIPPNRLNDPHIAFFLKRNPGYLRGDELACLTSICRDNLNHFAHRVIHATSPEWQC
jgi:hypothetical protein